MRIHLVFVIGFVLLHDSFSKYMVPLARKWTDLFCRSNKDCGEGRCCKGFICLSYLQEGELCLLQDKWKVGCGCQEGFVCTRKYKFPKSLLWRCYNNTDDGDKKDASGWNLRSLAHRRQYGEAMEFVNEIPK